MTYDKSAIDKCRSYALKMRKNALKMAFLSGSNGAHLGAGLSIIEIMATLYGHVMNFNKYNIQNPCRDRFILSKGHGTLGYYTALEAVGIITKEQLFTFEQNGGSLPGQPSFNPEIGIEYSSGSLGLGLSYGIGLAIASIKSNNPYNVYVLMGDGECNEGTIWESAMFAKHYKLSNLTAIIDANSMQSDGKTCDILNIDLDKMWKGFGWNVINIENGHDVSDLLKAFCDTSVDNKPKVIIAHTIKGKGISFMEGNNEWHHNRLTQSQYDLAIMELLKLEESNDN